MFGCELYFAWWAHWCILPFWQVWMSNVGVPNMQSGKYYFFSSDTSVACWPLSNSFLYFMELVLGLIVPWFLPFVWYKFLYGWFQICVWDFWFAHNLKSFFSSFISFFISLDANVTWYPGEYDIIIFREGV